MLRFHRGPRAWRVCKVVQAYLGGLCISAIAVTPNEILKLDAREQNMYKHGYKLDSEEIDFYCKELCLFNMLVHKEIGIPYESEYQYGEPYEDC